MCSLTNFKKMKMYSNSSVGLQILGVFFLIIGRDTGMSTAAVATSLTHQATTHCEFYNQTMCNESKENGRTQGCNAHDVCPPVGEGKRNHCYVLWSKDAEGKINISLKGCFVNYEECFNKTQCVARGLLKRDFMFCCCEGNMCNQNFTFEQTAAEVTPVNRAPPPEEPSSSYLVVWICLIVLGFIIFLATGVSFYLYRRNKHMFNELPTTEPHTNPPPSPYKGLRPIQLLEIKARGRFGAVWKAQFKSDEVAVKVFPMQDKQSWLTEQEIFRLPHMDHPNILQYFGVEKHGENLQVEFWLITAYHERGSLCDYLKGHTLTWNELCLVAETMAKGLMHLHEAIHGKNPSDPVKPAIAHRDFKSKNVLLKNDMTACIADFGLAIMFTSGKSCGDTHGQVGTRRYLKTPMNNVTVHASISDHSILIVELNQEKIKGETKLFETKIFDEDKLNNYMSSHPFSRYNQDATGMYKSIYRYMAPEVLEGAINFTPDSFLRIDMYACGLVLWELISRCSVQAGPVPEYRLPFEEEVGQHPTLEDMQESVVQRKVRPTIQEHWRIHQGLSAMCDTVEECWDHDAEARLSASCVMERVMLLSRFQQNSFGIRIENDAPLSPIKESSM